VKTREGAPEKGAFGPLPLTGKRTTWHIITKQGEHRDSWGPSAFLACAHVGLTLGQVADIEAR
jgi:hypothetical protein